MRLKQLHGLLKGSKRLETAAVGLKNAFFGAQKVRRAVFVMPAPMQDSTTLPW